MVQIKSEIGSQYGRLSVVARIENYQGRARWQCICECGNSREVMGYHLRSGRVQSCGCLRVDTPTLTKLRHGHARKHGRRTSTYSAWSAMMARCYSPAATGYASWGGRGIRVCDRWQDFDNFLTDMGVREYGMSLDRVDNNADYSKDNCRWATRTQQARNKSNNVVIQHQGAARCLAAWSEILGIPYHTLHSRIRRCGWTIERAFNTPPKIMKE